MYKIVYSLNRSNFTFSFPIYMPFISFPCLISLARTSGIMLNRHDKNGHLDLFLIWGESFQYFIMKYDINHRCFIYVLYQIG